MKKLLLIIASMILFQNLHSEKMKIIPKSDFIGVAKATSAYSKQATQSDPKEFYLGWNTKKNSYGRGYLQFDLSKVPSNASITNVFLELRCSASNNSPYFNAKRKISIRETSMFLSADGIVWENLANGPELGSCEVTWGGTASFNPDKLKRLTISRVGKIMYLSLNLFNESELVMLSGNDQELYLNIEYTGGDGGNPGTGECPCCKPPYIYIPYELFPGERFSLGLGNACDSHSLDKVIYDSNIFIEVARNDRFVTLIPKEFPEEKKNNSYC